MTSWPAHRVAGVTGIAAVVIFGVANALWAFEQPAPDASASTVVDFYTDASERISVGGPLSLLSMAVLTVFACALRRVLVDRGAGEVRADMAFAGLLLGIAPGLGAEGINMAAAHRAGDGALTEELALALFDVSYVLGSYATGVGFGVFTLAVAWAAWSSPDLLPRWLAIVALVIGVATVTPLAGAVIGEYTVGPPLLLVAVLGVRLLRG